MADTTDAKSLVQQIIQQAESGAAAKQAKQKAANQPVQLPSGYKS